MLKIFDYIFSWFRSKNRGVPVYNLKQVFGCSECPPDDCPTFLERKIHTRFMSALKSQNIIVVYGESRQGKTWTIERFCKEQVRIGCNAAMDIQQIKESILSALDIENSIIEHTVTEEHAVVNTGKTSASVQGVVTAGLETDTRLSHLETYKRTYPTVDVAKTDGLIRELKKYPNKYFVFDNFHYLAPDIQKQFCSLLKEFNYHNIKVVIVGVWKDASRITSLAPDLVNRCAHLDIGTWTYDELNQVAKMGLKALNIEISNSILERFLGCSAHNIGIFKDILLRFCQINNVDKTELTLKELNDPSSAEEALTYAFEEAFFPLKDRLKNLSTPQRKRSDSRELRAKIVCAILRIILRNDSEAISSGISLDDIQNEVQEICRESNQRVIQASNITQELGILHTREENRQAGDNFVPLFYYNSTNRKLLVLEPTLYMIKAFSNCPLENLVNDILHRDEVLV